MRSNRVLCTCLALVLASSCSTATFQPGKPITHGGPFGTFLQDGERVSQQDVRSYLKSQPETEYKASASQTWQILAIVPGAVGGFLFGYNLASQNRTSDTGLWIGASLMVVAASMGIYADSLLASATDTYNQKLVSPGKKSAAPLRLSPLLTAQPGTLAPGAGLRLSASFN